MCQPLLARQLELDKSYLFSEIGPVKFVHGFVVVITESDPHMFGFVVRLRRLEQMMRQMAANSESDECALMVSAFTIVDT
jgi:hypothetical protein